MALGLALLFFFIQIDDLLAIVKAALLAYPVGKLEPVALGACHNTGHGQLPVAGPAGIPPGL